MNSPSRAYLDTNVFIDAVEGDDAISQPVKRLLQVSPRGSLVTSELTLAEVLAPSGGQRRTADLRRAYFDLIIWSGLIDLNPVTRDVLLDTTRLREHVRQKLPDAIHLATAISAGCAFFISRDEDFTSMPDGMTRVTAGDADLLRSIGE